MALECSTVTYIMQPGECFLLCTVTQWLHIKDFILSDSTTSSSLSPSIAPITSQLVAHRGDVVLCFTETLQTSRIPKSVPDNKHSVFHWVRKKNPWMKCSLVFVLVFFFLNRVTYNPGGVFIHLLLSSFKMKMSTIKQAEMRLPECSTKQLMAVSAVRFYF